MLWFHLDSWYHCITQVHWVVQSCSAHCLMLLHFSDCYNISQPGWLQTIGLNFLTVLEARHARLSKVWTRKGLLEILWKGRILPCLTLLVLVPDIPQPYCRAPSPASVVTGPYSLCVSLLVRIPVKEPMLWHDGYTANWKADSQRARSSPRFPVSNLIPVNAPGMSPDDGPSTRLPDTYVRDLDGGSRIQPGSALAAVPIWWVN